MPFVKGQSGNPQGGKLHKPKPVQELARQHTETAINRLVKLASNKDPRISLDASEALLSRGWGKPSQGHTIGGDEDAPAVKHEHQVVIISPQKAQR